MRKLDYTGRVLSAAILYAAVAVGGASAQANTAPRAVVSGEAKQPAYDVVSIKPNKSGSDSMGINGSLDNFIATNVTLKDLLINAYDVKEYLITGVTGWADSAHFDINAKVVAPDMAALKKLTRQQRDAMLQQFLAERFKLKVHTQTEMLPVYEMVVARGGLKIKEVEPAGPDPETDKSSKFKGLGRGSMQVSNTQMLAHDIALASLAYSLSYQVQRTVVDKTGCTGRYDIALTWSPEEAAPSDSAAPSIFTALQEQLGLKLQSAKGPVETLVVDHVEMPSEN